MIIKVEGVEEFVLLVALMSHHSDALLSIDKSRIGNAPHFWGVFQQNRPFSDIGTRNLTSRKRTQGSASFPGASPASLETPTML
jgi:hypothetical protein